MFEVQQDQDESYDKNSKHIFYQNYFTAIKPNETLRMGHCF